jgi:type III secretion protein V
VIMLGMAFIPGFPWPAFVTLSAVFAAASVWARRRLAAPAGTEQGSRSLTAGGPQQAAQAAASGGASGGEIEKRYRIAVSFGSELMKRVSPQLFIDAAGRARRELASDIGMDPPPIDTRIDQALKPHHFRIEIEGVPVMETEIPADRLLAESEAIDLELLGVPSEAGPQIGRKRASMWVPERYRPVLAASGIEVLEPAEVVVKSLSEALRRYATQFIGIQETREILTRAEKDSPDLVKEAQKIMPLQKIAEILRRLLDENVPINNIRAILEAVVEWGPREQDTILLVEYVRIALRRQICFRCADRNRIVVAYMLERSSEDTLRSSVRSTAVGSFLSISDAAARPIVERIRQVFAATPETLPVILTSMDVRRHVRNLLIRNDLDVSVLSYQELAPEFSVQPLAARAEESKKKEAVAAA